MQPALINYILNYHQPGIPEEIFQPLKYPYLQPDELEKEKEKIAKLILEKYPDKISFNYCPKCNGLARTPFAKQCLHCGHDWH